MTIDLATKFQPILDEIYKSASLTAKLDAQTKPDFSGADTVKIFKTSVVGLGTYSRTNGYPAGDVTGTWETMKLTASRGRQFLIDRMDDEESLGMAFGSLAGEFIRTAVAPEVDAYRFAKYAGASGILTTTGAALDKTTILAALDAAKLALNQAEVPAEGRILYISDSVLAALESAISRSLANENSVNRLVSMFDNMEVVMVPQTRFYTEITLDAGATSSAGGFSKTATTGKDINFMIVHPSAVVQAVKHEKLKVFDPDTNQSADGYLVQYRLYHDAFVKENKVKGIYLHKAA